MSKHDSTRRSFLVRAAVGAGAAAGSGLVPDIYAQTLGQPKQEAAEQPHANPVQHGAFFNYEQAATMAAFTERLMPERQANPERVTLECVNYIDLALSGAYADLQEFYRSGLAQLDVYCRKTYNTPFARWMPARQDAMIAAMEQGKAQVFLAERCGVLEVVRTHTMEGMFADPIYGGNRDFAGWRLVGFPGAQGDFTPGDLQNKQAFTRSGVMGLQAQAKNLQRG